MVQQAQKQSGNKVERPQNKHLIPCKPGETRNPNGRPKGSVDIWARVRRKLREEIKRGPNRGKRYADAVANAIVSAALKGRWPQTKELLDREHGKPADEQHVDGTLRIEVVFRDPAHANGNGRLTHADNSN